MYLTIKNIALGLTAIILTSLSSNAFAVTSKSCPGENGYYNTNYRLSQNPKHGGFVSNSAFVDDRAFIAPTAAVCGSATVLDSARVYGNAVIKDEAEVSGDARVYGNAVVSGTAQVRGNAKVSANATIKGDAIIEGTAWVQGFSSISSGVFSAGKSVMSKPQSVIDDENRLAAAERARIARDKQNARDEEMRAKQKRKKDCQRNYNIDKADAKAAVRSAQQACNSRGCNGNNYSSRGSKQLRDEWSSARRALQYYDDNSIFRVCRG